MADRLFRSPPRIPKNPPTSDVTFQPKITDISKKILQNSALLREGAEDFFKRQELYEVCVNIFYILHFMCQIYFANHLPPLFIFYASSTKN